MKVIILNWNCYPDTLECVNSFLETDSARLDDIIIVDNGSSDNSVTEIRNEYPEVILLPAKENLGYAGGNNLGIKYALEKNADSILICNPDVRVTEGCIQELEKKITDHGVGIVGPKIKYLTDGNNTNIFWEIGGNIH